MIITQIIGGLGNQMFQYALGRSLSQKKNTDLKLDVTGFKDYKLRAYSLGHLNIQEKFASPEGIARFQKYQRKPGKKWFLYNRIFANEKKYFKERRFHFDETVFDVSEDCYLEGYWQTEKYFKDIEDVIRKEFTVKTPVQGKDAEVLSKIRNGNAISMHIRRGDYASDASTNDYFGTFSPEYYKKALSIIAEKVADPKIFVFSDDHEWVKKNILLPYPTTYVDHNGTEKNYEDMRLMNACEHFVISNSSFSWWGAWLSKNPDKIVVGPQKWFNNVKKTVDTKDIMPEEWIRL